MNTEKFLNDTRLYFGLKRPAACDRLEQCLAVGVRRPKFSRASATAKTCGTCPPRREAPRGAGLTSA